MFVGGDENQPRCEWQKESGMDQSPPNDATGKGAVLSSFENAIVKSWLHTERVVFLQKLGSLAAAKASRYEYICGHPRHEMQRPGFLSCEGWPCAGDMTSSNSSSKKRSWSKYMWG